MSRKEKRTQDLREAKDRKMKKVAVGLAVVLVAVLAFEVPKMLKSGGSSSSAPPAATTTADALLRRPRPALPRRTPPGTAAAAVTPVTSTKLPNSDTLPKVGKSQLYAFSHFAGKDPFVQQVGAATGPACRLPSPSTHLRDRSAAAGGRTAAAVTHHAHDADAGGDGRGEDRDQRPRPGRADRRELPEREPALQARLGLARRRADRHRERLVLERRADRLARRRPDADARRHG